MTRLLREVRPWRIVTLLELLEAHAEAYWRLGGQIGQLIVKIEVVTNPPPGYAATLDDAAIKFMGATLGETMREVERLNLSSAFRQAQRIRDSLDGNPPLHRLRSMMVDLHQRAIDELDGRTFLMVPPEAVALFKQAQPLFGALVVQKFPTATEDISEAGKCLALARATATVFHLMRVMELAVQKLGDTLGIHLTGQKQWHNILDEVNKAIRALDHKADRTKRLAATSSHLYNVKLAWRNEVMHPKQTYTTEEATSIFDAVKVFMNDLAALI